MKIKRPSITWRDNVPGQGLSMSVVDLLVRSAGMPCLLLEVQFG